MTADPKAERDIWTALFEHIKREYQDAGMSDDEADERASADVRRQIRESK